MVTNSLTSYVFKKLERRGSKESIWIWQRQDHNFIFLLSLPILSCCAHSPGDRGTVYIHNWWWLKQAWPWPREQGSDEGRGFWDGRRAGKDHPHRLFGSSHVTVFWAEVEETCLAWTGLHMRTGPGTSVTAGSGTLLPEPLTPNLRHHKYRDWRAKDHCLLLSWLHSQPFFSLTSLTCCESEHSGGNRSPQPSPLGLVIFHLFSAVSACGILNGLSILSPEWISSQHLQSPGFCMSSLSSEKHWSSRLFSYMPGRGLVSMKQNDISLSFHPAISSLSAHFFFWDGEGWYEWSRCMGKGALRGRGRGLKGTSTLVLVLIGTNESARRPNFYILFH